MLIIKEATEMDTQIFNASKQAYTTEFLVSTLQA